MFALEMLPADHGDCLWVEWGAAARPFRMLIDGGTPGTFAHLKKKIEALPRDARRFELLVVTHIDSDHIGGVIELLEDTTLGVTFGEVWFNGWEALQRFERTRGAMQGETLSALLKKGGHRVNTSFRDEVVMVREGEPLPVVTLAGGMRLTVLSPGVEGLRKLRAAWERECENAGVKPGQGARRMKAVARPHVGVRTVPDVAALVETPFEQDGAAANGSSIAMMAECEGARVLFTGDAWPEMLMAALEGWFATQGNAPIVLDALKLPHHGSRANSEWSLLQRFDCRRYLVSTDGGVFDHPDDETLARVVMYGGDGAEIVCNYRNEKVMAFADARVVGAYGYRVTVPPEGAEGVRVVLR